MVCQCDPSARTAAVTVLGAAFLKERRGLIRYLSRNAGCDAAADLVQEVYLRAASSEQVTHLVNPTGFLYRIARNILIDRSRRLRSRSAPLPLVEALDAPVPAEQEYGIEANDLQVAYDEALAALPLKTRQVFVMNRFDGMAYREIHSRLGISVATVEYHMMKALAHLRRAIAEIDSPVPKIISTATKVVTPACVNSSCHEPEQAASGIIQGDGP